MDNHPKFHISWLFIAREAGNITVALQEFASTFCKVLHLEEFCFCFKCFLILISICIYLFVLFIPCLFSRHARNITVMFPLFSGSHVTPMPGTQKPELHSKRTTKFCSELPNPANYADLELDPAKFTNLGGNKKHMKEL